MAIEIEHKYLVNKTLWSSVIPNRSENISQGFLLIDPEKVIRVRIKGKKGYITIKGKNTGANRPEFEYEIPFIDAEELLQKFTTNLVEKIRYYVTYKGNIWEVDEFKGDNIGLLTAEIELVNEDVLYEKPPWLDVDVTDKYEYTNASLSTRPFNSW